MKRLAALASLSMFVLACGGGGGAATDASSASPESAGAGPDAAPSPPDWKPSIKTAALSDDPCALIPVADVEAVMGTLAEPPRKADGCRYTFVMPEAVAARRQQSKEMQARMQENLRKAFGAAAEPEPVSPGSILEAQNDPRSYAVTVKVDVNGGVEGEQALNSMAKQFGFGGNQAEKPADGSKATADWDDVRRIPYGFMGRVGHVRVSVSGEAPDVPREQMQELAARVRDRIPDLPFAVTNPYQVFQLGTMGDPCSLLTSAEAEEVLGRLSMDPYRSSSYFPPLAHGQGQACAYFTPGHHVFVISPTWSNGKDSFKIEKGIGGLVGMVMPKEEMVVMKGPWDAAQSSMSGGLQFLKGDRMLEVHYGTSRASRGDAVRLAAIAMKRLAP
jgi:hypothetical protein